ncbi:hypothetical protein C8J56DRAFT_771700 [Mycena floridula]|nr:hypothetical protein C8J56DRAFT_771700 [Mycena floridula]
MNSVRKFTWDHPVVFFNITSFCLAFLSLGPQQTSFVPFALLLANLLVAAPILSRTHSYSNFFTLCLSLSVAQAAIWVVASVQATDRPVQSLFLVSLMSLVISTIALGTIFGFCHVRGRIRTSGRILLFPALWSTVWCVVSYISPTGRLGLWSALATEPYSYLIPLLGPVAMDWIMAIWAVILSQVAETWLMAPERMADESLFPETPDKHRSSPFGLTILVLALTIPSFAPNGDTALKVISKNSTEIKVGCILPATYKDYRPTFDEYLNETLKFADARILLWPENAVSFDNEEEREAAFERVHNQSSSAYVGVSFEEITSDPNGRSSGMALISPSNRNHTVDIYYKRHLVPLVESFSFRSSTEPPRIQRLELQAHKHQGWGTKMRPLDVTASICLDLAIPGAFNQLESRPALILAPARTWSTSVGHVMWNQANQRAREINAMYLWCDGGEEGLSGIGGRGIDEATQIGPGSWVRNIGIEYPSPEQKTPYAFIGDAGIFFIAWILVLGTSFLPFNSGAVTEIYRNLKARLQGRHVAVGNLLD